MLLNNIYASSETQAFFRKMKIVIANGISKRSIDFLPFFINSLSDPK
jgi:hypothetical protein